MIDFPYFAKSDANYVWLHTTIIFSAPMRERAEGEKNLDHIDGGCIVPTQGSQADARGHGFGQGLQSLGGI